MSGKERRRHKRVDCSLPCHLYVQGQAKPIAAEVKNISISGAFVEASQEIPHGSKVLLEFRESQVDMIHARISGTLPSSPDSSQTAEINLRHIKAGGIGVEFLNVRPEVQEFLNKLIDQIDAATIPSTDQ